MNLKIILKDPKYCEGCPCLNHDIESPEECNLDYIIDREVKNGEIRILRPQKCVDENGE